MPELTNVQLKNYANGVLRPFADSLARLIEDLPGIVEEYNAKDLGTAINTGGASNLIADGSETDGRTRCTGGDVFNLITLAQDLQTFFNAGRVDVVSKWQVNGFRNS